MTVMSAFPSSALSQITPRVLPSRTVSVVATLPVGQIDKCLQILVRVVDKLVHDLHRSGLKSFIMSQPVKLIHYV